MGARHEGGCNETNFLLHFLDCKGLSNDDVGVTWGTVFQEIRPVDGVRIDGFVKERLWGLPQNDSIVEHLAECIPTCCCIGMGINWQNVCTPDSRKNFCFFWRQFG